MAVPRNARMGCTMLGELVKCYEFAGKREGNQIQPRNGHNRSLHFRYQVLAVTTYYERNKVTTSRNLLPLRGML